ncbi:Nicotinate-nucleotide adenylyltransferase [Candidatus Providencia siddallii]|uniref:Probable nicotinate-nucleotide adenylyltransferase n=1 Tax=Candidatus Providencia siddallii TaxID=1715285 RepID=A0A0M6WAP5_9GAMM|nr:Nicotinate-nucleotide adenylyltransferase [Candidatus Providencia siddallii]
MINNHQKILVFFGGTFDPIHYGHIHLLESLAKQIKLKKIFLLPNNIPPHKKQPIANPNQRLEMIKLAIQAKPLFEINTQEFEKNTISYTIDTIKSLRYQFGKHQPIAFVLGQDALLSINTWNNWDKLLENCHLVVCPRFGYTRNFYTKKIQLWLLKHKTNDFNQLKIYPNGYIFLVQTKLKNISGTKIRQKLTSGESCVKLIPKTVINYIKQQKLYLK